MKTVAFLTTAMLTAGLAAAQISPESQASAPAITTTATLVAVPALVRSASGELVADLTSRDFRLTDNGVEQGIAVEHIERQPLSVVLLMQTGGAAPRQFANYRNITTMLEALMGSATYRIALVTFDSRPEEIWDFPSQVDVLQDAFTHPVAGDHGAAILDAVSFGIDLLKQQPATSRRVLLLLSQPQDDGSKASAEDTVRRLGESNTTIYSVTFSPEKTWLKDQFTQPRQGNPPYQMSPDHAPLINTFNLSAPLGVALRAMREDTAAQVATLSGGEHFRFGNKLDLERKLGMLANDIPNSYTLTFRPTVSSPGFHALNVEVLHHPDCHIVAVRTSYWFAGAGTVTPR